MTEQQREGEYKAMYDLHQAELRKLREERTAATDTIVELTKHIGKQEDECQHLREENKQLKSDLEYQTEARLLDAKNSTANFRAWKKVHHDPLRTALKEVVEVLLWGEPFEEFRKFVREKRQTSRTDTCREYWGALERKLDAALSTARAQIDPEAESKRHERT